MFQSDCPATSNQIKHYHKFKNFTLSQIKKAKKQYYAEALAKDTRSFYRCLQRFTGKSISQTHIECLNFKGAQLSSETDIVTALNEYFTNIPDCCSQPSCSSASPVTKNIPAKDRPYPSHAKHEHSFGFKPVTSDSVLYQINSLKGHKRGGVQQIPAFIYQSIAELLAAPLSILINESLSTSVFPDSLKIALVTPVYKNKGDRKDPSMYRPISSLPIFSKLFEIIINQQLVLYLESNKLLSARQFGFRKLHSSEQLIQALLQEWKSHLDDSQPRYIAAVSLDIRKAFDSVNHSLLPNKFSNLNLSESATKLLMSYLSKRSQSLKIGTTISAPLPITKGVPQGSILGPTLFNIAINGLLVKFPTSFAYADDTILYTIQNTAEAAVRECANLMTQVKAWYNENCLQLNLPKTQFCIFSNRNIGTHKIITDGITINSKDSIELLGVILDQKLSFTPYIQAITSKAYKRIYLLSRFKKFLNLEQTLCTYSTIIRPILEYCSSIILDTSKKNSYALEMVQNRAIRLILNAPRRFSITTGRTLLNLPTLESRRSYLFHKFVHLKFLKHKASNYLLSLPDRLNSHTRTLRSSSCLVKPHSRTRFGQTTFLAILHRFISSPKSTNQLLSFDYC